MIEEKPAPGWLRSGGLPEDLPVGVYTCTRDGLISYYNARAAELWGRRPILLDPSERYGGSVRLWSAGGQPLPHDETPMAHALRDGIEVHGETVVIERPDASRMAVRVHITPTRDESGAINGAVNVFMETDTIPLGTLAEDRGVGQLIDALGVAVYITDENGAILDFNEAAATLWGRRPEIGRDLWCGSWRIIGPDGTPIPLDQCPMAIALKEGHPVRDVEILVERPDGSRANVIPLPTPLRDDQGNLIGAVNVLLDVTAERRAQEQRALIAAIVESSSDAVIGKALDGTIHTWNPAAEQLLGFTADEILGRSIRIILPDDRVSEEDEIIARIRSGERIVDLETTRRSKDGKDIPVSLTVSPIRHDDGSIAGASTIAREITARKAAEEALRRSLIMKDEFLGLISHELRSPISVITGYAYLLEKRFEALDEEARQQALRGIQEESSRLRDSIDHLLAITRIETTELKLSPFSLAGLITDSVERFAEGHTHKVVTQLPAECPDVVGDRTLVGIVMQNLLTNAAKYSPADAPIDVILEPAASYATVRVRDQGIGLTAEELKTLFTPFYRSDRAKEVATGLGLGLTVCMRALDAMGGRIDASGEPGKGAEFRFELSYA